MILESELPNELGLSNPANPLFTVEDDAKDLWYQRPNDESTLLLLLLPLPNFEADEEAPKLKA